MPEKKSISAFYDPQKFDDAAIMKFMNQEVPDLYDILDQRAKEENNRAEADIRKVGAQKAERVFDDESVIRDKILKFQDENPDASPEEFDNFVMRTVAGTGNVNQYSRLQSDRSLSDSRRATTDRARFGTAADIAKYDPDEANELLQQYGFDPVDLGAAREVNVPTIGRVRPRKGGGFDTIVPARQPKEPVFHEPVYLEHPTTGQAVTVDSDEEYADLLAKGFRKPRGGGGGDDAMALVKKIAGASPEATPAPIPTPKPGFIMQRRKEQK